MSTSTAITVPLESIASCFEGVIPATICSCDIEGIPNLTFLSIVHRIDAEHVGLSYQFFNKTRKNIMENPLVQVIVVSPETACQYRLDLQYERTDIAGPAFDRMKTRLDAVASQTGMSQVFHLRGVDIYKVLDCRPLNSGGSAESIVKADYLPKLEAFTERLASCGDLDSLIHTALESLSTVFGYAHTFVMAPDEDGSRLYTVASHGYPVSGAGSEVWIGEGILGVAAQRRMMVRTSNVTLDKLMSRAVRSGIERRGEQNLLEQEIELPGLPDVRSQMVAPLVAHNELLGVLCLQSEVTGRFMSDDERVVQIAARHLAASVATLRRPDTTEPPAIPDRRPPFIPGFALSGSHSLRSFIPGFALSGSHSLRSLLSVEISTIKHKQADDSIFIDDEYLIKGIAGRILWKLLQDNRRTGKVEFTNKAIRMDATMQLPDFKDNLETRLILLRRRLQDHCSFLKLTPSGRGRFTLELQRQLKLEEQS